ncbi:OLC1v1016016C1 [Oldenlandia corymbosa var. corymbosa]|uniref:OLC1v1016016C1 n=1 Tax=Oldenlandia corymbosa var. corymbosa TaxID=529605 RepID=A0AAV1E4I0_OLDCO|nr:OLC1v1016016C1 [Oldenlandia corymbosa var. corymbosa]
MISSYFSNCSCSSSQPIQLPLFAINNQSSHFYKYDYSPINGHRIWVFGQRGKLYLNKCLGQRKNWQVISSSYLDKNNNTDEKDNAGNGGSQSTSLLSFLCPLLKLFSGGDPSKERNYLFEETTSSLSTIARLPWGSRAIFNGSQNGDAVNPPIRLQLYEFEACPFCRRVREALTELDLSAEVFPCPKGSVRHRELVKAFGGKEQFPFLIDPNTGVQMYESSDIVNYLFQQYGKGRPPSTGLLESTLVTGWMPTLLRAGRGMTLWEKSTEEGPTRKLELFSYENNAYARLVREALCELELPYVLQNVAKGSTREALLLSISGSNEVPFLVDPNTGQQLGDYRQIISYLFNTYSLPSL